METSTWLIGLMVAIQAILIAFDSIRIFDSFRSKNPKTRIFVKVAIHAINWVILIALILCL